MPAGGTLVIETANVRADDLDSREHVGLEHGAYVMLAISDTGIGMDAETRTRIFEPFFTTKAVGHGTGLGLATVHGIVSQSGGHIWVYSELDYGTTFKIYLPRVDAAAEAADAAQEPAQSRGGSGTILLVEDEPMVRELAARVLRALGYEVLEAGDPRTALQLCAVYADTIDVLLTDVIMPGGMNGRQLAEQVQAQYPAIKILYMSGYTDNVLAQHPSFMSLHTVLQKPFAPEALARTVWDVLHT
jgi:two-component system, cell cycle sensor histidine kinase and response regulator CckA